MAISLEKISDGIEHMVAGDLSARVEIDGEDEFTITINWSLEIN